MLQSVQADLQKKHSACNVLAESCDVSDEAAVEQLFAKIKERKLEIDVLVNNAGVNMNRATIKDSTVKKWWMNFVRDNLSYPPSTYISKSSTLYNAPNVIGSRKSWLKALT